MAERTLHPSLSEYFRTATQEQLYSGISLREGQFLTDLILSNRVRNSLEIGCAEGISSLFICDALAAVKDASASSSVVHAASVPSPQHTIIDPYQTSQYNRVGIQLVEKGGFGFHVLLEEPSELALPRLVGEGAQFDFAFIDGRHTFDHVLVDFFYVNRLLKQGGIVAFDDVLLPSIRKVMHYVATYPCYRLVGAVREAGWRRSALNGSKQLVGWGMQPFRRLLGDSLTHEWVDGSLVRPRLIQEIDYASMVAFQKVAEDERPWNWYRFF